MVGRRHTRGTLDVGSGAEERGGVEVLLDRWRRYLLVERELDPGTVRGYVARARPFVAGLVAGECLDLAELTPADVYAFVLADCGRRTRGSAKLTVTALRSLLRFLYLRGEVKESLAEGVPPVAHWQLSGLPRHLESDQVQALFDGCDRATPKGLRDFAILKLLVRLGLRRCEVARLRLDDVDWRAGEIVIHGKRDRHDRLPLPDDVGRALAAYMKHGRPNNAKDRHVFIGVLDPPRAMSCGAISHAVARCGERAGVGGIGAHRLRHTAATEMLAAGVPLAQIGQVLRHRHAANTAIYAKVDREALRTIARPWPGATR